MTSGSIPPLCPSSWGKSADPTQLLQSFSLPWPHYPCGSLGNVSNTGGTHAAPGWLPSGSAASLWRSQASLPSASPPRSPGKSLLAPPGAHSLTLGRTPLRESGSLSIKRECSYTLPFLSGKSRPNEQCILTPEISLLLLHGVR